MAKKSVRLLSLLLSVLMLVSMVPIVATAEYDYDAAAAPENYVKIPYDGLVGEKYQDIATDVYVVDADWDFKAGEEPEKVTFTYRNRVVTEKYDATRHLTSVAKVYEQAALDGVKMPMAILTEGNYSDPISLTGSIYILGARAGMNPNVPSDDPSVKWNLSSERALADYASSDPQGETRFWIEGAIDVGAGYGGGGSAYNTCLFTNNVAGANSVKYVFDGIVMQGYGAVIKDTQSGTGTRDYILQNCIFNNGWSYDVSTIRLWNRYCTSARNLSVSNSYATGYKQLGFYSGQGAKIQFNGMCWQDNYAGLCYDVEHIQQLGLTFSLKNSHFWNSTAVANASTLSGMFHYDRIFWSDFNQGTVSYLGTNKEPYRYTISNNTFWNMERMSGTSYATSYNLFEIPMGGENEKVVMENNIFGNTLASVKRHPLQIRYLTVKGVPSHSAEVPTLSDTTALYALTNDNLQVNNNTFIGKAYTNVMPEIGTNTADDTLVEMTGNFYTTTLGSNVGTYVKGNFTDKIYDKWVWEDNSEEGMQDPKNRTDYINEDAVIIQPLLATQGTQVVDPEDPYHYILTPASEKTSSIWMSVSSDSSVGNSHQIYTADENWNKLAEFTGNGVTAPNRENYYVVSVLSRDERTALDYKLSVVRPPYASATLNGIKEESYPDVTILESDETDMDLFTYKVDYAIKDFSFDLDLSEGAVATVYGYNSRNAKYELTNNGTVNNYTYQLAKTETPYKFEITVTGTDGKTESYAMQVIRSMNTAAAVEGVTSGENEVEADAANKTYTVTVPVATETVDFALTLSEGATAAVTNAASGGPLAPVNGTYTAKIKVGTSTYPVTVTSQDGSTTEEWTVKIVRPASSEKEILSIKNATKKNSGYTANVSTSQFIVDATVSDLATYAIYADEACTVKIADPAIALTTASTVVWLQVIAEDGTVSEPVKLTIKTNNPGEAGETPSGLVGNGIVAVNDAIFDEETNVITVNMGTAKTYDFKVVGLNGYTVKTYADPMKALWTTNEMSIALDSGFTYLYVTATKGEDVKEYTVAILSEFPVDFTDEIVEWAKPYVSALEASNWGILKGDEHGALDGDANLTRFEMAVMVIRMMGINKDLYSGVKLPFNDAISAWAENYVKAAYQTGIISGTNITDANGKVTGVEYKGDTYATRAEFVKVIIIALYGPDAEKVYEADKAAIDKLVADKKFTDQQDVEEWAVPYMYLAIRDGIIKGDMDRINPNGNITRYEVAVILARTLLGME